MTSGEYKYSIVVVSISLLTQHGNIFIKIMKCFWYPLQKNKMTVLFLAKSFWGLTRRT
ncbi:unnamed protein product [Acanthoscelides obtectus]|uniref:Uncharacterized protein n=1 Tax=Acanthoscelides obtectus TaxID=200917 RepID=A0A9P0KI81_ACAOB|nr:unnamed protein product [Acanthoscelides obtectus]CAH1996844.1 unnamed protein product [Acanthoscelides obtectus]CAK1627821.1 hypothetical protein AOBTE_LOCUS4837 [Acanthoscelides obtectus]CAK1658820.1 hypothetical protein AOBTE_LOCUS21145 [Acanthoscelides obtectus]